MSILNLILDLLLLGLFAFCIIRGAKLGLIKSLFFHMRAPVAFILAFALNHVIGNLIKDVWIGGVIYDWVHGMVLDAWQSNMATADTLAASIPDAIKNILGFFGVSVGDAAGSAIVGEDIVHNFSQAIANPLSSVVSSVLAFVFVFLASLIVLMVVGFILDKIFRISGLKTVNRVGGAIIGVISGLSWVWCATHIIVLLGTWLSFIPFVGEQFSIEGSVFLRLFYSINPFQLLLAFAQITA